MLHRPRIRMVLAGFLLCRLPAFIGAQSTVAPAQTATRSAFPAPYPGGADTPLGQRVAALLADPAVSRAHWGIAVTALDGTPLYGLDEGKLFRPASTAKLFTTAAAMAMMGPDKRFTTSVQAEGTLEGSTLRGNLVLRGGGDANFAGSVPLPYAASAQHKTSAPAPLADIAALAARVASAGIRTITGDVIGDDTYFENVPYSEGWAAEDLLWGYGAPASALTVHDNFVDLTVTAGPKEGTPATLTMSPDLPFYTVNSEKPYGGWTGSVVTMDFGRNQIEVERRPGSRELVVAGDVAAKYGPDREQIAITEPAEYAATALRSALEERGIRVSGKVRTRHWDSGFVGSFLEAIRASDGAHPLLTRRRAYLHRTKDRRRSRAAAEDVGRAGLAHAGRRRAAHLEDQPEPPCGDHAAQRGGGQNV